MLNVKLSLLSLLSKTAVEYFPLSKYDSVVGHSVVF